MHVTSAPLSNNDLDQSGMSCEETRGYSWVTEDREVRHMESELDFKPRKKLREFPSAGPISVDANDSNA